MRKKIIKISAVVVLVGLLGWAGYDYYFGPDPEMQTALKSEFGEGFFTFDSQGGGVDSSNSIAQQTAPTPAGLTPPQNQPQPGQDPTAAPDPAAAASASQPLLSEAEIIAKYQPRLESLERQCNGRLADLAAAARNEYHTRQASGTLDKNEMVKKYIQAGEMLEGGADTSFYNLLNAMQAELKANGQPTTVVTQIEARYKQAKTQRRDALLSQAGLK